MAVATTDGSTFFFDGDTDFLAARATRGGVLGVDTDDTTAAAAAVVGGGAPPVPPASAGFPAGDVIY